MVKRKHSSYGGFQPLELKQGQAYYSEDKYNLLKYNSAKVGIDILIEKEHIQKIFVPFYLCPNVCREIERHDLKVEYYSIDDNLLPIIERAEAFEITAWKSRTMVGNGCGPMQEPRT